MCNLPGPGIKPVSPALEDGILNHWTTREIQGQILIPVYSGLWGISLYPSGPYFFTCKMRRKETFHNDPSGSDFLIDHLEASVLISHEDLRVSLDMLFLINSVTLAQVLTSPPSQKSEPHAASSKLLQCAKRKDVTLCSFHLVETIASLDL